MSADASQNSRSVNVALDGLVKAYGAVQAVRGIDLRIEAGKTVSLLGPSGCGKTTTLRCIAGLETPTAGRIAIGDRVVYDGASGVFVEPEKRNIGMVFQSYAIWPHMTVGGNVGFPLRIARTPKAETREKVQQILDLVGLGDLRDRSAAALSGGQQQRVALARALVHRPNLVLFDEPLSNLDANLRERMRSELQILQADLGFTAIYVTHDQEEAMALSDRVVIMSQGVVEQEGTPEDVFNRPRTLFTAKFLGYANELRGRIEAVHGAEVLIDGPQQISLRARWQSDAAVRVGDEAVVAFRPDHVVLGKTAAAENRVEGKVEGRAFLGTYVDYAVRVGDILVEAEGSPELSARRGDDLSLHIPAEHCHAFPAPSP